MSPRVVFVAVLAMSALAGLTSPSLVWVLQLAAFWLPEFLATPAFAFYGASLIVSVSVLLVSGVAAAAYERIARARETDAAAMVVWLAAAGLLTLPGIV